jgi:hypothetical protein
VCVCVCVCWWGLKLLTLTPYSRCKKKHPQNMPIGHVYVERLVQTPGVLRLIENYPSFLEHVLDEASYFFLKFCAEPPHGWEAISIDLFPCMDLNVICRCELPFHYSTGNV